MPRTVAILASLGGVSVNDCGRLVVVFGSPHSRQDVRPRLEGLQMATVERKD